MDWRVSARIEGEQLRIEVGERRLDARDQL